jgi:hypothetical protein
MRVPTWLNTACTILTRFVSEGAITPGPPGLEIAVAGIYSST